MKEIAPELAELVVIVTGMLLLSVGLAAWLGWEVAAICAGALLLVLGSWSATSRRGK